MTSRFAAFSVRRHAWRMALLIVAIGTMAPRPAAAHPMGNFSINHYAAIGVAPSLIELRYVIDMAEIPTFQEMREHGFAADPADPRVASYLNRKCRSLRDGLILTLNGRRLSLRETGHNAIFPPGAGGLPTMKMGMRLEGMLAPASQSGALQLDYHDFNFPGHAGWKEVIAVGHGGVALADSSVPDHDRSAQLSNYPVDLLNSPPQVLEAHLRPVVIGAGAQGSGRANLQEAQAPLRANRIGTPRNAFTELMTVRQPGTWFLLTAAMIAIALGALHALEPGHGKTVVAAYLVGSRGTARHALMLAATVTASHTASVYVLGGLTLYASRWIVPERIYPWLGGVSGAIIAGLGVWLFGRRLIPILSPDHSHDHLHDHAHPHEHPRDHFHIHDHDYDRDHEHHAHAHDHDHSRDDDHPQFQPHRHDIFGRHIAGGETPAEGARLTTRGLLALGVTGGIVPCPAALVVLLSALSLNRAGFGLFLIVAFSAGLAAVLVSFGLGVVYARQFVARRLRLESGLATRWLPLVSSAVITIAGVAITVQALARGGVIGGWR